MLHQPIAAEDVLDLEHLAPDHRAACLSRAFRALLPGEAFWIAGRSDPHHFEHYLKHQFPGEVDWVVDYTLDGGWIARIARE
jgi:uncharacterized protein (DUF2249 family)